MKIAVLSDLHGILPEAGFFEDDAEVLVLCGDILPLKIDQNIPESKKWFENEFKEWRKTLKFDTVIFIAGNHDFYCELNKDELEYMFSPNSDTIYLHNTGINYLSLSGKIYKIFGTPYCKIFGSWSFMRESWDLKELYEKIPENLDLLICHDAPQGVSDQVGYGTYFMKHVGGCELRDAIIEKRPRYVVHGHIHTSNHGREVLGASEVYNTSLVNEQFEPVFKPLYLFI
jgi:Icc-related predicted phosphoesterase